MNPAFKNVLLIVAKNALNAVLTNAALAQLLPGLLSIHTADGWWNIGKVALAAIAARELAVWVPVLLKWSSTDANP